MSNRSFDVLCAKQEILDAKQARNEYGRHLVRTDIEASEVEFLARAFRGQIKRLALAKQDYRNGNF